MKPLLFALLFVGVVSAQDRFNTKLKLGPPYTCNNPAVFGVGSGIIITNKDSSNTVANIVRLWDEYKKSLDDKYNKQLSDWAETINIETRSSKIFHLKRTYSITIDKDGWTYIETGNNIVDTFKRDTPTFEGFIEYLRNKR